jgi:Tfp pilus assembly major pilin PilA
MRRGASSNLVGTTTGLVLAEGISVDDFLSAVEGGETKIQQPTKVKVDEKADTLEAATAQDAVNAAVEQNKKEIGGKRREAANWDDTD